MIDIRFAREPFTDALFAKMLPLLREHWKEVAHYPDIPLDVDASVYHAAEARGALRVYTARADNLRVEVQPVGCEGLTLPPLDPMHADNVLVGYAVFFVRNNPHYASSLQAVQDVIYVAPMLRGGNGARFIAWCDIQLQHEHVQAVYHHVKTAHNWGKLLERMGYEAVDVIYAKRLDKPVADERASIGAVNRRLVEAGGYVYGLRIADTPEQIAARLAEEPR